MIHFWCRAAERTRVNVCPLNAGQFPGAHAGAQRQQHGMGHGVAGQGACRIAQGAQQAFDFIAAHDSLPVRRGGGLAHILGRVDAEPAPFLAALLKNGAQQLHFSQH